MLYLRKSDKTKVLVYLQNKSEARLCSFDSVIDWETLRNVAFKKGRTFEILKELENFIKHVQNKKFTCSCL